jgi:AcrR family transcriptional regulator
MPATQSQQHRAPRRDAAENRSTILEAAAAALNRDIDASLATIAETAGLSRRAIYGHFATRDELVTEVLLHGAQRVGASLNPITHPDARVEIALYGSTLWAEVAHVRVMAQLAVRGPHRSQVAAALAPARARLYDTVVRGVATGALRADIAPTTLARLIEGAALAVLDEANRTRMSRARGHELVMLAALSTAGLGWREADQLIASTPELAFSKEASA